ncbi:stage II sporulation protein D [Pseudoclostridium thermosuccinogenes]|uniref:stage II sporulation protein D n=1 Tax=Clostridium thermosuccinogenes TaxID=84032 RepID=UPI002FDAD5D5
MKKIIVYAILMIIIVIIFPMLIVRGCDLSVGKQIQEEIEEGGIDSTNLEDVIKDVYIKVYIKSEDKVQDMKLEEYIKGVVAAEMPAEFGIEALKAQAVAARTYAYGRLKKIYGSEDDGHKGADICTDVHCQAWVSKEEAMDKWGIFSAFKYWNKIERAVNETRNIILTYEGKVVNPVFHSSSGGRTENAEDVWEGAGEPYLRSVVSMGEEAYPGFETVVRIKIEDFRKTLEKEVPGIKIGSNIMENIQVIDYTEGGRVKNIKIGNTTLKGTDIRRIFSLKSANFKIEKEDEETLRITTIGNGHGVGMSQWGANYLAKNGSTYEDILKYYYRGTELEMLK